jgi:hypothetical protein
MRRQHAHLFLLHELRIGAVIDDILPKDGCAERGVYLLRIHVLELAVQDEVVPLRVQAHCHLPSEENEGKHIAVLLRR